MIRPGSVIWELFKTLPVESLNVRATQGTEVASKKEHYQRMAAECLELADDSDDPGNKALLLSLAQSWAHLAKLAQDFESVSRDDPEGESER